MLVTDRIDKTPLAPVNGILVISKWWDKSVVTVPLFKATNGIIKGSVGSAVIGLLLALTSSVNIVAIHAVIAGTTEVIAAHAEVTARVAAVVLIKPLTFRAFVPFNAKAISVIPEATVRALALLTIGNHVLLRAIIAVTSPGVAGRAPSTAWGANFTIEELAVHAFGKLHADTVKNVASGAVAPAELVLLESVSAGIAGLSIRALVAVLHAGLAHHAVEELVGGAGHAAIAVVVGAVPAAAAIFALGGVAVLALSALTGLVLAGGTVVGALVALVIKAVLVSIALAAEALEVGTVLAGGAVAETAAGGVAVAASIALVPLVAASAVPAATSAAAGPLVEVETFVAAGLAHAVDEGTFGADALSADLLHVLGLALVALSAASAGLAAGRALAAASPSAVVEVALLAVGVLEVVVAGELIVVIHEGLLKIIVVLLVVPLGDGAALVELTSVEGVLGALLQVQEVVLLLLGPVREFIMTHRETLVGALNQDVRLVPLEGALFELGLIVIGLSFSGGVREEIDLLGV